jgi:hypothetical protein
MVWRSCSYYLEVPMINAILIPPALDEPLKHVTVPEDFRLAVSSVKLYGLENPGMYLYAKGINRTPFNIRATLILWAHDHNLAYRTMIAGQALLTGKINGVDVDVPEEVVERIFKAQCYKVEAGDTGDGMTYAEVPFVYAAGVYHRASAKVEGEVRITGM